MDKGAIVVFIPAHSRLRCGRMRRRTNLPAKGITAWGATRLGCTGPLMNCIAHPMILGDESLETGSAELWVLDSKLQHFVCGYLLPCRTATREPWQWREEDFFGKKFDWSITSGHVNRIYSPFKPALLAVRSSVRSWSCAGSCPGD